FSRDWSSDVCSSDLPATAATTATSAGPVSASGTRQRRRTTRLWRASAVAASTPSPVAASRASQRQGRGAEAAAPTARAGPASAGSPPRGDVTTGSVTDPVAVSSMYTPARSGTKPASKLAPVHTAVASESPSTATGVGVPGTTDPSGSKRRHPPANASRGQPQASPARHPPGTCDQVRGAAQATRADTNAGKLTCEVQSLSSRSKPSKTWRPVVVVRAQASTSSPASRRGDEPA